MKNEEWDFPILHFFMPNSVLYACVFFFEIGDFFISLSLKF